MVESEHPFPNDYLISLLTDGSPSYPRDGQYCLCKIASPAANNGSNTAG